MSRTAALLGLSLIALVLGPGQPPRADEEGAVLEAELAGGRLTRQERPFAFVVDPSSPSPGVTTFEYRAGFASGMDAERPLPASLTSAGGSHAFTLGHGLASWLAPFATATLVDEGKRANVLLGARVPLTAPYARLRATLLAAGFREAGGVLGLQLTAAGSYDAGALRVAGNVQAEKAFDQARDRIDVLVTAGASWSVAGGVRLGAEYVGQDLEEAFSRQDAEGGARHLVGPSAALDLDGGRYQLALAGGFGLTAQSPRALVRGQMALSF